MIKKEILEPYLHKGKKHPAYDKTVEFYNELKIHANGEFPAKEIKERRPGEPENTHKYREKLYTAITKGEGVGLVINALSKIRRSADWVVKFDPEKVNSKIKEGEAPEDYINKNFGKSTSITNWCFSTLLKEYAIDANGVILVAPQDEIKEASEYLKPLPMIFNSDRVYEVNDEWALLKSDEHSFYNETSKRWEGDVFYVVDKEEIVRIEQDKDRNYVATSQVKNRTGYLPIITMEGLYFDSLGTKPLWESRLQAMAPRLKEFVREYNDNQAEVVQHIFSEKYSFVTQDCSKCKGVGEAKKNGKNVVCPDCRGSGKILTSPFNATYAVRSAKTNMGEQQVPNPPVGYVEKNTEIVKIQDERCEKHMYKAFCAVALQHLFQMPLNTSGYKKELDMDESITTVHNVAEDLVRILDHIIRITIDWRYSELIPDEKQRDQLRPFIPVPEKFDIISTDYMMEEVNKARTSALNPAIINQMEREIASKKFYSDPLTKDTVLNILDLDPLPGYNAEQKMTLFNDGITSETDYIISTYIQQFVRRAVREHAKTEGGFLNKEFEEKMKILEGYAKEVLSKQKKAITEAGEEKEDEAF